jgi:hypothetical protein
MITKITTGIMVQMISALVLCTMLVSATAPCDLRKDDDADDDANPKRHHVQAVDFTADAGDTHGQVVAIRSRGPSGAGREQRRDS